MLQPGDFIGETGEEGGLIYSYTNDTGVPVQCEYASVTAPSVVRCLVKIDDREIDIVYAGAGGSHSWWTNAGGRLMSKPLQPGETLCVWLSGAGAFRIDWP